MKRFAGRSLALAAIILTTWCSHAVQRFPRPDFESAHEPPALSVPAPRAQWWEVVDVGVLAAAVALASYLALKRRSARGLFWLAAFAVLYFGFWRQGCVCAVGSVQNVSLAFADPGYAIPWTVIAFFALPLLFTLFFGRTFCAAVCPLGALQELVIWRPRHLPLWLNHALAVIPPLYLGAAIYFAALGGGFIICRFDPFIGFFRLGAAFPMLVFGGVVLLTGMFIARPYCRFLCPYGVLLGWMSACSRHHVSITPGECIGCELCENACPVDAIRKPSADEPGEDRSRGVRRIAILLAVIPLAMAVGGVAGYAAGTPASYAHKRVALAQRVRLEDSGRAAGTTLDSEAFRASGETKKDLFADAAAIQGTFRKGGIFLGAFAGLIVAGRLLGLARWRARRNYEPDRVRCVSCGRCFAYCPVPREES